MSVRFSIENDIARITIDRPERLNAVDDEAQASLVQAWEDIEANPSIRAVVLTGTGDRAFCAGSDMKKTLKKTGLDYWADAKPGGYGGITLRNSLDVPVIARVNGHALGGGFEMVLGCDIVVASENATFGLTEPRVGRLALEGGIPQIMKRIPHVHAMGLLLTGRRIDAKEAMRIGLVNEVVPHDQLDTTVDRWLADITACAPLSVRATKAIARASANRSAEDAQALLLPQLVAALNAEDQREGVNAFKEKRPPVWSGR